MRDALPGFGRQKGRPSWWPGMHGTPRGSILKIGRTRSGSPAGSYRLPRLVIFTAYLDTNVLTRSCICQVRRAGGRLEFGRSNLLQRKRAGKVLRPPSPSCELKIKRFLRLARVRPWAQSPGRQRTCCRRHWLWRKYKGCKRCWWWPRAGTEQTVGRRGGNFLHFVVRADIGDQAGGYPTAGAAVVGVDVLGNAISRRVVGDVANRWR